MREKKGTTAPAREGRRAAVAKKGRGRERETKWDRGERGRNAPRQGFGVVLSPSRRASPSVAVRRCRRALYRCRKLLPLLHKEETMVVTGFHGAVPP
ncbi:hypothetical protein PIB30_064392 [Stylosanthes scabra]|uniref:Uncharacterized protein n=1 Tax=Stylosanthes scabra TaxID=79078 RepID=A0ABU6SLN7_9FABA|nr:hypothetical protein [Stylosanthes scabra]